MLELKRHLLQEMSDLEINESNAQQKEEKHTAVATRATMGSGIILTLVPSPSSAR